MKDSLDMSNRRILANARIINTRGARSFHVVSQSSTSYGPIAGHSMDVNIKRFFFRTSVSRLDCSLSSRHECSNAAPPSCSALLFCQNVNWCSQKNDVTGFISRSMDYFKRTVALRHVVKTLEARSGKGTEYVHLPVRSRKHRFVFWVGFRS